MDQGPSDGRGGVVKLVLLSAATMLLVSGGSRMYVFQQLSDRSPQNQAVTAGITMAGIALGVYTIWFWWDNFRPLG